MKIKKIKVENEFIYPATITNAIKDINFISEDETYLTQADINQYFNSQMQNFITRDEMSLILALI